MSTALVQRLLRALGALLLCCALLPAQAHKPSDSLLTLQVDGATVSGRWDIALRDLDHAIGLDANGDGAITWGELRARHADIAAYALARLALEADGSGCTLQAGAQQVDSHTDGAYTVIPLHAQCARPVRELRVRYTLFADLDPLHRGLVNLQAQGRVRSAVLGPAAPDVRFALQDASRWSAFTDYARDGVWHIAVGYDHILFLLSLLLPAVLRRQDGRWQPVPRLKPAFTDVLKVVTAFTLAHSITLSLATLKVVELPSRLVESSIAASVVLAALNNVWPLVGGRRWVAAFGFGLLHGFGFASVLTELGLPTGALALALLGFNLGVEAGQLAIVALFLPLAYALRTTALYRRWIFHAGSLAIALVAAVWLVERLFDLQLLPLR
jgi:hypothetical protein